MIHAGELLAKEILKRAESDYYDLVNDVAGSMVESSVTLDTAMLQAENDFYNIYRIEVDTILKLLGKTREDWKRDAILKARGYNLNRT